jgi:carbon storage regulator
MLVLTRRTNQVINIHTSDGVIEVHLIECNHQVRLGFVAPDNVTIMRSEIDTLQENENHSREQINLIQPQRKTIFSLLRELFTRGSTGRQ